MSSNMTSPKPKPSDGESQQQPVRLVLLAAFRVLRSPLSPKRAPGLPLLPLRAQGALHMGACARFGDSEHMAAASRPQTDCPLLSPPCLHSARWKSDARALWGCNQVWGVINEEEKRRASIGYLPGLFLAGSGLHCCLTLLMVS